MVAQTFLGIFESLSYVGSNSGHDNLLRPKKGFF